MRMYVFIYFVYIYKVYTLCIHMRSLYMYLYINFVYTSIQSFIWQRIIRTRICSCTHAHVRPKPFDQYPTAKYHGMAFFQLTARLLH